MTQGRVRRNLSGLGIALAGVAMFLATAQPIAAQKPIEKYEATSMNLVAGRSSNINIRIYAWSTDDERKALIAAFQDGGNQALYDHLHKLKETKGALRIPNMPTYEMYYAYQFEDEGKKSIIMAADRPIGYFEVSANSRRLENNISLMMIEIDPETGTGKGRMIVGAHFGVNKKTGQPTIESASTTPIEFTKVRQKGKKKE
jgi:hypothetical protein